jgi:hypothetical protein
LLSVHEECLSYYFLCFPCLLTFLCHWCLWYVLPRLMEVCSSVSISWIFFNLNVNTETGQFSNTASKFYDNASCVPNYIYTCLFIQTCKAKLNDKTNYYIKL